MTINKNNAEFTEAMVADRESDVTITQADFEQLEEAMAEASNEVNDGAFGGMFSKVLGLLPRKITETMSNMMNSDTGSRAIALTKDVARETAYNEIGMRLQRVIWHVIQKHTAELSKHNKVVYYITRTSVGQAASTLIVCSAGVYACVWAAGHFEAKGHYKKAQVFNIAAKALTYSAGNGVLSAFKFHDFLDDISNKILGVIEEVGVDVDALSDATPVNAKPNPNATSNKPSQQQKPHHARKPR